MQPRDRGIIIQVGSALAYRGIPLQAAYCAAKHAIQGFCDSLRCELLHDKSNVRLTMIQMPALNTPQFSWVKSRLPRKAQPVPPIFEPEVAARAIVFASHRSRREIYVGNADRGSNRRRQNRAGPARSLSRPHLFRRATNQGSGRCQPAKQFVEAVDAANDHGAHGTFDAKEHTTPAPNCGRQCTGRGLQRGWFSYSARS